jgi:hypothetical protein
MILNYHGVAVAPAELNAWLINNSGYDEDGDVDPSAIARYASKVKNVEVAYLGRKANDTLENHICAYGPHIAGVNLTAAGNPKHWVVATGRDENKTTYLINDPNGGIAATLTQKYNNKYSGIRAFGGPEHIYTDLSGIRIKFYSPGELLLIDPEGRRVGYDPIKGVFYDEIPGASYETSYLADVESGDPGPPMKELEVMQPLTGDYELRVTGTDIGTYDLTIAAYDVEQNPSGKKKFDNIPIIPGQIYSYGFSFAKTVGSELEVFGGFDGRGQRPVDVNKFLSYISPAQSQTKLPAGTTRYNLMISYSDTILPSTFDAKLNGVDISSLFNPTQGGLETVAIALAPGRNTLVLAVEGNLPDRVARDSDRLVFIVP